MLSWQFDKQSILHFNLSFIYLDFLCFWTDYRLFCVGCRRLQTTHAKRDSTKANETKDRLKIAPSSTSTYGSFVLFLQIISILNAISNLILFSVYELKINGDFIYIIFMTKRKTMQNSTTNSISIIENLSSCHHRSCRYCRRHCCYC